MTEPNELQVQTIVEMPPKAPTGYYSTKQLQERYGGISTRALFDWRKQRGFPEPVLLGLYDKDQVHDWEVKVRKAA